MTMTTEQMEMTLTKLIKEFLPPVTRRLAALEAKVAELAKDKKPVMRKALTYEMYVRIMEMKENGLEAPVIAKKTGVPYTTVRRYLSMPEERIEELRHKAGIESESEDYVF